MGVSIVKCTQSQSLALDQLKQTYRQRLSQDFPHQSMQTQQNIVRWLTQEVEASDRPTPSQLETMMTRIDYRYRILQQRYLAVTPSQAYGNLINRLGSLMMRYTQASLGQDQQRVIAQTLPKVLQESLRDCHIQEQITLINQCTQDKTLQDALLLSSLEEYFLQAIGSQPLLFYKLIKFLSNSKQNTEFQG